MTDHDPDDPPPRERSDIVAFHDRGPPPPDFGALMVAGLNKRPKSLAGQMLLDRRSAIFRRICALPEYYLHRAELEILREQAVLISRAIGPDAQLIDFGRGFGQQSAMLLAMLDRPWAYVAIDREGEPLLADARRVQRHYPRLWVEAVRADIRHGFDLPPNAGGGRRIAYLPGNAIGNFDPARAIDLLAHVGAELRPGGLFLIGVDLRKSTMLLESAYDDPHGLNAALVFDILHRANRELGTDFDVRLFEHGVHCDVERGRVHADLVSRTAQQVRIAGETISFAANEPITIEESWKYSVEDFQVLARGAGFRPLSVWLDNHRLFSVHLLEAA